jgi:hypothetical protein
VKVTENLQIAYKNVPPGKVCQADGSSLLGGRSPRKQHLHSPAPAPGAGVRQVQVSHVPDVRLYGEFLPYRGDCSPALHKTHDLLSKSGASVVAKNAPRNDILNLKAPAARDGAT